jgi:xanthine/CO dehydrogenase XdhC/CoxF family maturation factor
MAHEHLAESKRGCGTEPRVGDIAAAQVDEHTDVVLTDHHRPEAGPVLKEVLAGDPRWVGIWPASWPIATTGQEDSTSSSPAGA